MKISTSNYLDQIGQVNLTHLPETLTKGHNLALKASEESWKMYRKSETIKRVLDLYFEQLGNYMSANQITPHVSKKPAEPVRREVTRQILKASPQLKKSDIPAKKEKPKAKDEHAVSTAVAANAAAQMIIDMPAATPAVNIEKELKLLNDFFAILDGRRDRKAISSIMNRFDEIVSPSHEYKDIIEASSSKLKKIWDYMVKHKLDTIDIELTDKKFGAQLADTIAQSSYFNTANFNEKTQCFALNYPISSIHTDTSRFQNRKTAFSEVSARNVAENFDVNKFDPVVVWDDPKDKKVYIISGHSRFEGLQRRKAKTVPVRFFSGNEQQAIQFAKVEANRSQERENLSEDIIAFRIMRDGDKKKRIAPAEKQEIKRVFKDKYNKLEHFSYLNPNGLCMIALSSNNPTEFPYIERTASWIGQLRKNHSAMTNTMEDNMFGFFYNDQTGKNIKIAKDDFIETVENRLKVMKPSEKLIFTSDGKTIDEAKQLIENKLKNESFRKLKEINELLQFLSDRLKTTDRKLKVWTSEEEKFIKGELNERLQVEKKKLEKDLDHLDKDQTVLQLLGFCQPCRKAKDLGSTKTKKARSGQTRCKKCKKSKGAVPRPKKNMGVVTPPKLKKVVKAKPLTKKKDRALAGLPYEEPAPVEVPVFSGTEKPTAVTVKTPVFADPGTAVPDILKLFKKSNEAPEVERPTFTLPGEVGRFMGRIERFEYAVVLRGDRGAGKSTLVFRLLDSFADWGFKSAFLSLEMNPESSLFDGMMKRYVKPENQELIMKTDAVNTIEAIHEVAKHFPVVVIDSWTKVAGAKQEDFDKLRKANPETIFIVIFQSTTAGTARSGFMAEYDAGAVIHVHKSNQGGRAVMVKNRYSEGEHLAYYVHENKLIDEAKAGHTVKKPTTVDPDELVHEMIAV